LRRKELGERFSSRIAPFTLLHSSSQVNRRSRSDSIVATCVSGSGNTIAIIRENEFLVYKAMTGGNYSNGKPKYVGRFEANGNWTWGLDGTRLTNQGRIVTQRSRCDFNLGAITDNVLAAALLRSNCLMLFSIAEGQKPGKCITTLEPADADHQLIRKILFHPEGFEMAVLYSMPASHKEVWQFFSIDNLSKPPATTRCRRPSVASNPSTTTDGRERQSKLSPYSVVKVDMTLQDNSRQLAYHTRAANYSQDGRKLVSCTAHVYGTAIVSILAKDQQNSWRLYGSRQIRRDLHNWDEDCLGFTSIAL
jgi:hypothetical protein